MQIKTPWITRTACILQKVWQLGLVQFQFFSHVFFRCLKIQAKNLFSLVFVPFEASACKAHFDSFRCPPLNNDHLSIKPTSKLNPFLNVVKSFLRGPFRSVRASLLKTLRLLSLLTLTVGTYSRRFFLGLIDYGHNTIRESPL